MHVLYACTACKHYAHANQKLIFSHFRRISLVPKPIIPARALLTSCQSYISRAIGSVWPVHSPPSPSPFLSEHIRLIPKWVRRAITNISSWVNHSMSLSHWKIELGYWWILMWLTCFTNFLRNSFCVCVYLFVCIFPKDARNSTLPISIFRGFLAFLSFERPSS